MTASLEALFAQHDCELLGYADTAFVFARPEAPEQVVKIGVDVRDGWPVWAAWAQSHPSPHVPRIRSCTWVHDAAGRPQIFVGIMERLRRSSVAAEWLAADRTLKRDPLRLAARIEETHPGVADLLRAASYGLPGAVWDAAPSNWMERADGTLVLTDPIARFRTGP